MRLIGGVSLVATMPSTGSTGHDEICPTNHLHYEKRVDGTRVDPGPLEACHGSTVVTYPNVLGSTDWNAFAPCTKTLHSDGTGCVPPPLQDPPPPPDSHGEVALDAGDFCPLVHGVVGLNGCPESSRADVDGDARTDLLHMWHGGVNNMAVQR